MTLLSVKIKNDCKFQINIIGIKNYEWKKISNDAFQHLIHNFLNITGEKSKTAHFERTSFKFIWQRAHKIRTAKIGLKPTLQLSSGLLHCKVFEKVQLGNILQLKFMYCTCKLLEIDT